MASAIIRVTGVVRHPARELMQLSSCAEQFVSQTAARLAVGEHRFDHRL
jgi:hypothetical protein